MDGHSKKYSVVYGVVYGRSDEDVMYAGSLEGVIRKLELLEGEQARVAQIYVFTLQSGEYKKVKCVWNHDEDGGGCQSHAARILYKAECSIPCT
jgi:hypothetical protein